MPDIIGAGWHHPARLTPSGAIALASGTEDVEEAIGIVLRTMPGERPMRPQFGCDLYQLLFAPLDAGTVARAEHAVRTALDRWEPRITVEELRFATDTEQEGVLYIDILYRLRTTNEPRNLVFPFYTLPQDPQTAPTASAPGGTS
ncbi:GPW/gp25 family protein [Streptomyces sp. NPDC048161]|uniref:GPW/gp25 family protein n=1 Tax=Streptomyces sp. NPDC048161 TaxID=3160985 RepID=UPI0033EECF6C